MKSQDVKESHFEAIKILTDLEGNLSTCQYFAISLNGFGRSKQGLKTVCSQPQNIFLVLFYDAHRTLTLPSHFAHSAQFQSSHTKQPGNVKVL